MICMGICHFDETNSSGGLDKQARALALKLQEQGEDVIMLASTRKWRNRGWQTQDGADGTVRVRFFWTYHSPQISGRYLPAALIWAFQVLVWLIWNRKQVDVFHGHQIRIHAFAGAIVNKFFGVPHILKSATGGTGADIKTIASRKYFKKPGRNFIIRHTNRFIATTDSIKEDLLEGTVPAEKIVIIPNGVTFQKPETITATAAERQQKMMFLGRLTSDKNVLPLARAYTQLENPKTELHFYGKGNQQDELNTIIANTVAVQNKGFHTDIHRILPEYGYLILPSNAEGLSNAMLEAMTCGIVPIVTRVSGCVDHVVDGETGFFIENVNEEEIRKAIERAISISAAEWQVMSDKVATYAERFSLGSVATQYQALYQELKN